MRKSSNLDLLRTAAIFCVVVPRLLDVIGYGHLRLALVAQFGILCFMIHTGLGSCLILERLSAEGPNLVPRFYLQRFFRVYPLALLCILAAIVFNIPREPFSDVVSHTPKIIAANLLLIQNLVGGDGKSLIAPLWPLPYAVQFYLILPLLFVLMRKRIPGYLLLLASIGIAFLPLDRFSSALQYLPCFLAGVVAYEINPEDDNLGPPILWPFALIAVAACYVAALRFSSLPAWIASIVVGLSMSFFREFTNEKLASVLEVFARYSYALYIAHLPVLWISFEVVHSPVLRWITFAVLIIAVPALLHHLVEQPLRVLGNRLISRKRVDKPAAAAGSAS